MNIKPTTSPQKVFYEDINIIRLVLIVLLVIVHAFAPYAFSWPLPVEIQTNEVYAFIAEISFSFMLPMFVFISGFLFENSRYKYQNIIGFRKLVHLKFKHLIVPSCIFSLIYILLFRSLHANMLYMLPYNILNGVGHLWFLPMLFWCFIMAWLFEKMKINIPIKIVMTFLLSLFSLGIFPLQWGNSCSFFLYFYLGMLCCKYQLIVHRFFKWKYIILFGGLYLFCFVFLTKYIQVSIERETFIEKYLYWIMSNLRSIIISLLGLIWCYLLINVLLKYNYIHSSTRVRQLGGYCMGVYIIHQFILWGLYYYTSFPQWVGSLALPWLGFLITLIGSLSIVHLMLKSKIGRFLIG